MTRWTEPANPATEHAWRNGPRWWHVAVVLVNDPRVAERRAAVAALLGDLVHPSAPDHPHVTAWVTGIRPPSGVPEGQQIDLHIGGAALFTSAAYLTVRSPALLRLRQELAACNPAEDRSVDFIPHMTVGVFRSRVPLAAAHQLVDPAAALPQLWVTGTVRHLVVDTRSSVGALHPPPGPEQTKGPPN